MHKNAHNVHRNKNQNVCSHLGWKKNRCNFKNSLNISPIFIKLFYPTLRPKIAMFKTWYLLHYKFMKNRRKKNTWKKKCAQTPHPPKKFSEKCLNLLAFPMISFNFQFKKEIEKKNIYLLPVMTNFCII